MDMTQLFKVKTKHKKNRKIMQPKKHKKTNSRPNRAVWTVFVNCTHWI